MKLFVGLGNPGAKYARNRHNVGFMAVETIAERHGLGPWRRRFHGEATEGTLSGERVLLLKPTTYMNDSGRSVGEAQRFLKIPLEDIYVFHDEIDLAPGKLKVKTGGGNAGHNGLRSISAHSGNDYNRVRIGVGHPGVREAVAHYVLHDFAKVEYEWLEPMLDAMAAFAPFLAKGDAARFLSQVALKLRESDDSASKATSEPSDARKSSERPPASKLGKGQGSLADSLKKWLMGKPGEE